MPWAASAMLHLGVFLIVLLIVAISGPIVVATTPVPVDNVGFVEITGTETPEKMSEEPSSEGRVSDPLGRLPSIPAAVERKPIRSDIWNGPRTGSVAEAFSSGLRHGGEEADFRLVGKDNSIFDPDNRIKFPPTTRKTARKADSIVYVLDASGSVLETFDRIRNELKNSVFKLDETQSVHVIFFRNDSCAEAPARRLVSANTENKVALKDFVNSIEPMGHGSSPIPALGAALRAMKASAGGGANLVYLLTDGDFDQSSFVYKSGGRTLTGTEAVIAWLRENNKDGFLHVSPIVLGPAPEPRVEEMMRTIAKENGGEYRYVSAN